MTARSIIATSAFAVVLGACAAQAPNRAVVEEEKRTKIALLGGGEIAELAMTNADIEHILQESLAKNDGVAIAGSRPRKEESCADELACIREVGSELAVDKIIVTKIAALGDTVLVRLSLIDVKTGTQEQTLQEVVRGGSRDTLRATLASMAEELTKSFARPTPPPEEEWYARWWIWAAASGAAVLGAGAVAFAVTRSGESPDQVITPP